MFINSNIAEPTWSWVERLLSPSVEGRLFEHRSKTDKLAHVASLVSVHHLKPRAGLVGPVSV